MRAEANLLAIVEDPERPFVERAEAGEALGKLGDPRALSRELVAIPAGPFLYRGSGEGGEAKSARTVHLTAFAIDRYPVTVAAYAAFIEAGGYRARRFWSRAGWA
ncbi:MAG: SUMF1/EgtB/PvdO family nonheme iron enzyme [Minicystis sp.]